MQNEKTKLTSNITNEITLLVNDLRKEKPEKDFTLKVYEANMYWCVNWKSTKHWKADKYFKEYFQVQVWIDNKKYSLLGEHRVEDVFEHLSEEHFFYKEKTIKELLSITDEIIQKTKEAVLEAVDKELDSTY
jgi:hypothetical protein